MAQVTITVNDKRYILGCADGEEDHLRSLAAKVNDIIGSLKTKIGTMDDARMLLMAAMILADERDDSAGLVHGSISTLEAAKAIDKAANDLEKIARAATTS